jgi:outer membrane protein OmpA-like peptidoglycan-associated protein
MRTPISSMLIAGLTTALLGACATTAHPPKDQSQGETAPPPENKTEGPTAKAGKDQSEHTRAALGDAESELGKSEEQLAAEQNARAAIKHRAKNALDKLAQAGVAVKEESRGTVITIPSSDLFDPGQTRILSSVEDKLAQVADALKEQGDRKIGVEGYTDSRGSEDTSQVLSQQRADAVRSYLVTLGVPGDRIEARGFGSARPVASNDSDEGRADNRRVEIVVVKPLGPK